MKKILFVREVSNSPGLYITDESGSEPEPFLQDEISFVSCSTKGELFALLLRPISPDLDSHYLELLLIDLVSSKYKVFSSKPLGPFDYARCSPGGKYIAFQSERPKGRGSLPQLFLVKPDSDKIFQLTSDEDKRGAVFPNWVSDDCICFDLCRSGGWHSLDLSSGAIKALDLIDSSASYVCATPDGKQLFWVEQSGSYDSGGYVYAIVCHDTGTGQQKKVFVKDYMMMRLIPYPDGSKVLYTGASVASHGCELHLLDLADGSSVRLTDLTNRESVIDYPACVLENWSEVSVSPVWKEIKGYIEARKYEAKLASASDSLEGSYHDLCVEGITALWTGDSEEAVKLFQKAVYLCPSKAYAQIQLLEARVCLCDTKSDVDTLLRDIDAIENLMLNGTFSEPANDFRGRDIIEFVRAQCFYLLNDKRRAAEHCRKALEINPDHGDARKLLSSL